MILPQCVCVVCSKLHRNCLRLKTPSYLRTCLLKLIWNLIYSWGLSDIDSDFLYVSISSKSSTNAQCPSVLSCMRNVMEKLQKIRKWISQKKKLPFPFLGKWLSYFPSLGKLFSSFLSLGCKEFHLKWKKEFCSGIHFFYKYKMKLRFLLCN